MTDVSVIDKAMCCAAGIQLGDSDLIQACIVNGTSYDEYELTYYPNECIKKDITTKMYRDAEMNPI